jgi:predicted ATPase/DNA-binding XRE family transcriptional regulator
MLEPISFGTWLRQKRRSLDLTQKAFADQIGCAEITVRRMEADEYKPSSQLAFVLFEKLGVPEPERTQWVRFARGLAPYPNQPTVPSPPLEQRTNLPIPLTSFIGRKKEQDEIRNLITKNRLVTLVGVGGIGKTRLSIQAASALLDDFPYSIWLVELAPLADPALVPQSIINTLGLIEQANRSPQSVLADFLRAKKSVLILDNCEHLIQACAQLAETLLHACPDLHILTTSREALRIDGETVYLVSTLTTPDPLRATMDNLPEYEAVQLFLERAQSVMPGFSLTRDNASAIAQVCHRLDGIPLALELAAARVKMMTVEEIAKRLDDRFHLLTGGMRTLPRHQTLRAMVDWSYNLLSQEEKTLFRRLAVFIGGWTLEAAESVCGDTQGGIESDQIVELLSQLITKSLVTVENVGIKSRYHCLETIRQYGHEKLLESGESEAIRKRHVQFFLEFAVDAVPHLYSAETLLWCDRMEADHDNLRLALEWTQQSDDRAESGLQLVNALLEFWLIRGYLVEGRERASSALNHGRFFERTALYAKLLCNLGWLGNFQGDFPGGRTFANKSLAIFRELGDKLGISYALQVLGAIAVDSKDYVLAESLLEEAFENRRGLKDVSNASLLITMGWAAFGLGDYALVRDRFNQVLTFSLATGKRGLTSEALGGLAEVDLREGRYESASELIEESLRIERENGDKWHIGVVLGVWAWVAVLQRDWELAFSRLKESVAVRKEINDRGGLVWCLEKLGQVVFGREKYEKAAIIFSAAASIRTALGSAMDPFDQSEYERSIAALRDQLGEERFNEAWDQGHKLTLEKAIDFALEEDSK